MPFLNQSAVRNYSPKRYICDNQRTTKTSCRTSDTMQLLFLILLAGASLSLVRAVQNASTVLPSCAVSQLSHLASQPRTSKKRMSDHSKQDCSLQALNESTCTVTNLTCVCKDPTFAAVFLKCETANCIAAEQSGLLLFLLCI